jgi:hypothetical protein
LRRILKNDRPEHGLIAGYFAGFSMLFYKSSTLAMYMMAKLLEVRSRKMIKKKNELIFFRVYILNVFMTEKLHLYLGLIQFYMLYQRHLFFMLL